MQLYSFHCSCVLLLGLKIVYLQTEYFIKEKIIDQLCLESGTACSKDAETNCLEILDPEKMHNIAWTDVTRQRIHHHHQRWSWPVSYTHLDVYKRQVLDISLQMSIETFTNLQPKTK